MLEWCGLLFWCDSAAGKAAEEHYWKAEGLWSSDEEEEDDDDQRRLRRRRRRRRRVTGMETVSTMVTMTMIMILHLQIVHAT